MSKGLAGVKTLTAKQIADKWKLPLAVIAKKIAAGVKVEKEHTTSLRQANEIARDHLGERPDYYEKIHKMEKTKIVKEDMTNVAGVSPRVSTQNIRQMVQGGRTPPSGTPNLQTISTPGGLTGTFSGNDAASKYAMDKQRHFDLNKAASDGYKPITSNAPRKDITSAADDQEAKRQAGTSGPKDPEIEKAVRNYRYGVTNSDTTPSSMKSDITPTSAKTPTTPGSVKVDAEIQKYNNIMHKGSGSVQEENATGAVRGLGYVTGDPGVNAVDQYINTNALAYDPFNGAKLEFMKKFHNKLHKGLGFDEYNPTSKKLSEAKLNELGEYDNKGGSPGYEATSAPIRAVRKRDVEEQSPANISYKERPMYEKSTDNNPMPAGAERGIYQEATYQGKKVALNKPMKGDVKKSKVYVDPDGDGKAQKVNFGDKKLSIKKDQPNRKKSYCARSGGITGKKDVTSANYWSRKAWNCNEMDISNMRPSDNVIDRRPHSPSIMQAALNAVKHVSDHMPGAGIGRAIKKYNDSSNDVTGSVTTVNEISAELVGKVSNARFFRGEAPSRTLSRAINKKFIESGKKKKEVKEDANRPDRDLEARTYTGATGTTHTVKEETKMDNKELINEALDCILEDNLPEMKDNLMKALQEKAIEKLEERKKEIAANYFAQ